MTRTAVGAADRHPDYRWVTTVAAAERLGVSVRQLYRLIDRGHLPAYRIAGEIRLLAYQVDEFRVRHPDPNDPRR